MKFTEDSKLVSIVVPIYNVEQYLDACISSLACQTYSNLEILLILDGTQDDSLCICENWQEKDPRIRVFVNDNFGVSYTRNFGIENSTGEYITFVDSDDLVAPDYVERLVTAVESGDCDMASVSRCCFNDGEETPCYVTDTEVKVIDQAMEKAFFTVSNGFVASHIYKASIIKEHGIRFNTEIAICEDMLFNFEFAKHARSMAVDRSKIYGYRQRQSSAVRTVSPRWFSVLSAYKILFYEYKSTAAFPYIVFYYLKNLYEAKYHLARNKDLADNVVFDIKNEMKAAERFRKILTFKQRVRLFICKYAFWVVYNRRK